MLWEEELMSAFEPGSHEAAQALEAFREAAWEQLRPCVLHRAELIALDETTFEPKHVVRRGTYAVNVEPAGWGARLGDLVVPGATPEDALRNFDQAFRGKPCEKMIRLPDEEKSAETGRECWRHEKCALVPGHDGDCAESATVAA
jgi:hypothetical protein